MLNRGVMLLQALPLAGTPTARLRRPTARGGWQPYYAPPKSGYAPSCGFLLCIKPSWGKIYGSPTFSWYFSSSASPLRGSLHTL